VLSFQSAFLAATPDNPNLVGSAAESLVAALDILVRQGSFERGAYLATSGLASGSHRANTVVTDDRQWANLEFGSSVEGLR
jgi:hypothetical protein